MAKIRFPNDSLVEKEMKKQDRFWSNLLKKKAKEREKKIKEGANNELSR